MRPIGQILKEKLLIFDGAIGTELYNRHVFTNRSYDEVSLSIPSLVSEVHRDYVRAGADVLTTNSYGANAISLREFGLAQQAEAISGAAARLAHEAADACVGRQILVAGSLGPILADGVTDEQKVAALAAQARALLDNGADFLLFETLPDQAAAICAARAVAQLGGEVPFVLSHAMPEEGASREAVSVRLMLPEGLPQPEAYGFNCGIGPANMLPWVVAARKVLDAPLIVQPNAGMPRRLDGRQMYLCSPEYISTYGIRYSQLGVSGIGGCCGTTPTHTAEMARMLKRLGNTPSISAVEKPGTLETTLAEKPLAERSRLGRKLANHEWVTTIELAPPMGWDSAKIIERAKLCKEHGIDVLNVPDGPRACPRMSALATSVLVQQHAGIETVLHVCGRDRNLIGLQADLLGAAACGIRNFLMITGDPPKLGSYGSTATGVFDIDSIGLVRLQKRMNQGVDFDGQPVKPQTEAVIGVGADPSAVDFEREVRRMREKAAAGADYITTQPVFDPQALFRFMDAIADLNLPVIAGIWPLVSLRNAIFMRNEVPGVVVPDEVMRRMSEPETGEGQLAVGLQIARETLAAIRDRIAGVQISAPLGRVQAAFDVLEK